jgi:3-deoxy-D-arabino-heptulosonate 7-phosphate (DAHP) synthase class II
MSLVFIFGGAMPVVEVGCMRSLMVSLVLPTYRGDIINLEEFTKELRRHNPMNMDMGDMLTFLDLMHGTWILLNKRTKKAGIRYVFDWCRHYSSSPAFVKWDLIPAECIWK